MVEGRGGGAEEIAHARILYRSPNLRFDGSSRASRSQNVLFLFFSMWENLTSHEI